MFWTSVWYCWNELYFCVSTCMQCIPSACWMQMYQKLQLWARLWDFSHKQHCPESFGQVQPAGITLPFCRVKIGEWNKLLSRCPYLSSSAYFEDNIYGSAINMSQHRSLAWFYIRGKDVFECGAQRKISIELLSGWKDSPCCCWTFEHRGDIRALEVKPKPCVQYAVAVAFHLFLAGGPSTKSIYWCHVWSFPPPVNPTLYSLCPQDFLIKLSEWMQFALSNKICGRATGNQHWTEMQAVHSAGHGMPIKTMSWQRHWCSSWRHICATMWELCKLQQRTLRLGLKLLYILITMQELQQ